tara:strand:- start:238 stop:414 length:177 start_codon:yes stop_codon:yes gene_type:complete
MKNSTRSLSFSKNLSRPKHYSGVSSPVYSVVDDNLTDDYHEMKEWEDWKDWSPNSWGY